MINTLKRTCPMCHKIFNPRYKNQQFCKSKCAIRYSRLTDEEKRINEEAFINKEARIKRNAERTTFRAIGPSPIDRKLIVAYRKFKALSPLEQRVELLKMKFLKESKARFEEMKARVATEAAKVFDRRIQEMKERGWSHD